MSNEHTKEADDVVVDNVEEGISNEEADAPETTDNNTNQTSAAEEEPWWKQKRVLIIGLTVLVIIVVVAIVLGVTLSSSSNNNNNINNDNSSSNSNNYSCFNADDGGEFGILYNAVRAYVDQDCVNNQECDIGQTYGWPMNSWCLGNVNDMSYLFQYMDTFNENISDWNTSSVTSMKYM